MTRAIELPRHCLESFQPIVKERIKMEPNRLPRKKDKVQDTSRARELSQASKKGDLLGQQRGPPAQGWALWCAQKLGEVGGNGRGMGRAVSVH